MNIAYQKIEQSWSMDRSHLVLGNIFDETKSIAIWSRHTIASEPCNSDVQKARNEAQKEAQRVISNYFDKAFTTLGHGINGVFEMETLRASLSEMLPEFDGRETVVDDIFLLSDMLTCLFNCNAVGLRLVPLTSAMCPKFHVDNIPVRLVTTYLGEGTQWLPLESVDITPVSGRISHKPRNLDDVQQLKSFDVALLKGKAWDGHEHLAAVHRSCAVEQGLQRVLLSLDPM